MNKKIYNAIDKPTELDKEKIVIFLNNHLEQYGDDPAHIKKSIDYACKDIASFGGFLIVLEERGKIVGAAVVNFTGMSGYIPPNILVYIAVHAEYRGEGLGKMLMKQTLQHAKGDIALHVEKDNPARFLYEKMAFTNPYLEMRLKR